MLIRRIFDHKLAQASYLVACEHARVCAIVDPNRDIAQYIEAAQKENVQITHVTETHIHADFVSGARDLAAATGAQLLLSDCGGLDWTYVLAADANAVMLKDKSTFSLGDVRVDVMHTPGHTPEHISFLLTDTPVASTPMGALTGDFIFVGDVGRPDLLERAAGMAGTMEAGARQLFQSLQALKKLPDYLQIWPGHGAGSACGKALGAMPQSTLGYERLFNWALAETDEERFVQAVLEGQPEPPAYFATMKRVNRDGAPARSNVLPQLVGATDAVATLKNGGVVVDTRPVADFSDGHAIGTTSIPRNKSFLNWSGALLPYDKPLLFISSADDDSRRALASDLSLIGIDSIEGVLPVEELPALMNLLGVQGVDQEPASAISGNGPAPVLDVRGRSEYAAGHIPSAINIPLGELQSRLDEVPEGGLVLHCQGGSRSIIAASILQRDGRSGIVNMTGGFAEWERSGLPVERG
ncbi:MAG TPA: MBL fold metallo-hydrolase [Gemmatimonadaceae bacterium]|nr:MBL fold metallo-hydrolase [Gemmatimonadaceae bacterium]